MASADIDRGAPSPSPLYIANPTLTKAQCPMCAAYGASCIEAGRACALSTKAGHACALCAKAGRARALSTKAGFGAQPRLLSKLRNLFNASHGQYYTTADNRDFDQQLPRRTRLRRWRATSAKR